MRELCRDSLSIRLLCYAEETRVSMVRQVLAWETPTVGQLLGSFAGQVFFIRELAQCPGQLLPQAQQWHLRPREDP